MEQKEMEMITPKSWQEFRETGLLWWNNMNLHTFGWAIAYKVDKESGKILEVYPARVKFRGFKADLNDEGYRKVSRYLKENAEKLYEESML